MPCSAHSPANLPKPTKLTARKHIGCAPPPHRRRNRPACAPPRIIRWKLAPRARAFPTIRPRPGRPLLLTAATPFQFRYAQSSIHFALARILARTRRFYPRQHIGAAFARSCCISSAAERWHFDPAQIDVGRAEGRKFCCGSAPRHRRSDGFTWMAQTAARAGASSRPPAGIWPDTRLGGRHGKCGFRRFPAARATLPTLCGRTRAIHRETARRDVPMKFRPGARVEAPPTIAAALALWCGERNGRLRCSSCRCCGSN